MDTASGPHGCEIRIECWNTHASADGFWTLISSLESIGICPLEQCTELVIAVKVTKTVRSLYNQQRSYLDLISPASFH